MSTTGTKKGSDLARYDWTWDTGVDGRWAWDTLRTAAICETARQAQLQTALLERILARLDQLGSDGVHQLVREGLREVRAARRARLAASKATRRG